MAGPELEDQAIFEVARKLESAEARQTYLRQACGEDPEAVLRIGKLLHGTRNPGIVLPLPSLMWLGTRALTSRRKRLEDTPMPIQEAT